MTDISRRRLLKQAAGGAALLSARPSIGSIYGQVGNSTGSVAPRIRESFDFGWKFFRGDTPGAQNPDYSDAGWRTVDLPHDWSIEGPFGEKEPSGGPGGYLPTGFGWYRKHFSLPASHKDRNVIIEFDGVYENSEVWINGQYLGKRPYGYIPFFYDMTPHLAFGRENVVAVKVDNSRQTNCRWYSGSGIYRHTWLLATHRLHIGYWGVFVTTPRISKDAATVQVKTIVHNEGESAARCTMACGILDKDGRFVQSAEAVQEIESRGKYEFVQQLRVERPALWSVDDPYLYQAHVTLCEQNRAADELDTPFGIREALFDGRHPGRLRQSVCGH